MIRPGYFGSAGEFHKTFVAPIQNPSDDHACRIERNTALQLLNTRLSTVLLRRGMERLGLPGKIEYTIFCKHSDQQQELYTNFLERRTQRLLEEKTLDRGILGRNVGSNFSLIYFVNMP
jgi:SNF2 family DNA or RNA helicase